MIRKFLDSILSWFRVPSTQSEAFDLQREIAFYTANVGNFNPPPKEGEKFVLIHGNDVRFFASFDEAIAKGYKDYKRSPFLVQPVDDSPIQVARFVQPERAGIPMSAGIAATH